MNNKGFMMAEVVVVASVVLVTLVSFYTSYNKIISLYNKRVDYYDVTTLYELANFRDTSLTSDTTTNVTKDLLEADSNKAIYYVNKNDIKKKQLSVLNQTFKDYIEFLSNSLDFQNIEEDELLVMERCITDDNCKYAYLEVLK